MGLSKKEKVRRSLRTIVSDGTGCGIQHDGWPCNTCFHHWAIKTVGLNPYLAHVFWGIILALRGDYSQDEIMDSQILDVLSVIKSNRKRKNV